MTNLLSQQLTTKFLACWEVRKILTYPKRVNGSPSKDPLFSLWKIDLYEGRLFTAYTGSY
ncbi:hypothetical protein RJ60_12405 [Mesotoga sp. B105.6.4]|nr:hypothetical protein RJ60_12405 [Mesotoga sp. B105.6.4]RAM59783.1 hypothetical protein DS67_01065 [Mesotoga sp. SC_4PWA21]